VFDEISRNAMWVEDFAAKHDMYDGLLQHLALGEACADDEKCKTIVELVIGRCLLMSEALHNIWCLVWVSDGFELNVVNGDITQ
jgi:hypothetical protein